MGVVGDMVSAKEGRALSSASPSCPEGEVMGTLAVEAGPRAWAAGMRAACKVRKDPGAGGRGGPGRGLPEAKVSSTVAMRTSAW